MTLVSASLPPPLDSLSRLPALKSLGPEEFATLGRHLEPVEFEAGTTVVQKGTQEKSMYFVVSGSARLDRQGMDLGTVGSGEYFGELGLFASRARPATVVALSPLRTLRLTRTSYDTLAQQEPQLALKLTQLLLAGVGDRLTEMTESVGLLLRERSLPRRTTISVRTGRDVRTVRLGTKMSELLPEFVNGWPVIAGLLDRKPVTLTTHVTSDCEVAPLTAESLDGQRFYRNSQALLLLEATHRVDPRLDVSMSHSVGMGQRVSVAGVAESELEELALRVEKSMCELVAADLPLLEEWWTVEEARDHFVRFGWKGAAALLATWRDPAVPLVSYGDVYALSTGPLLPTTGMIGGFQVLADQGGLLLMYGQAAAPRSIPPGGWVTGQDDSLTSRTLTKEALAVSLQTAIMTAEHERWLSTLGITSVGDFNTACIAGQVSQLIYVSEGFQEKSIGRIADDILRRHERARVVCIAGPSSAGKTTFIKRLKVQLQVNGINPVPISLDNYYVDRELTPRDSSGELDFEALEALKLKLLHAHISALVRGEEITTARYDFQTGTSYPEGGPRIQLEADDILMMEGIHGLNPRLLAPELQQGVYRVFVCPLAQLPFDGLHRVHVSDVRLVRRIVRDRHTRGHDAVDSILRWPSVRAGERRNIFAFQHNADAVFDSSLIYELAVLKVFAERYLLEVPQTHAAHATAFRLLQLLDRFVTLYPDNVPKTSILREFIGGSAFSY